MRFVACQSFAGGFDLGATRSGFTLVHKVEQKGGFGLANVSANRHLVGRSWSSQACVPAEWEPMPAEVVLGNPPCSGFSALSPREFRGVDSPINSCMHALIEYAARVDPQVVVFESVQAAYSQGRPLMQLLREKLASLTGQRWTLYHVKHNAASVGGCAIRPRYFFVASRIPFGVDQPTIDRLPLLDDAIADLEPLALTWNAQPVRRPASWWVHRQRMTNPLVDGHQVQWTPYARRCIALIEEGEQWGVRENVSTVARRFFEKHGRLPDAWSGTASRVVASNFNLGYNQLVRWNAEHMARVITGGALSLVLHPRLDRPITHREAARIMGFPDSWVIYPLRSRGELRATWGKQIPVQTGEWITGWIKRAIEGEPGDPGTEIGDDEWLIDVGPAYRHVNGAHRRSEFLCYDRRKEVIT